MLEIRDGLVVCSVWRARREVVLKVSEPQKRMRRGSDVLIVLLYRRRSGNATAYRNIRGERKGSLIMQAERILGYEHGDRGRGICSSFGVVDYAPLMMPYAHKPERSHDKPQFRCSSCRC